MFWFCLLRGALAPSSGGFSFQRFIHSSRCSYYLFFNYLFFNYLYGGSLYAENLGGGGFTICGECGGGGVHYMRGKLA